MQYILGKYNGAKVFTNNIEETAKEQIRELCSTPTFHDSIIRIMPDVHAGAGCTIGTTMTITDKVVPNLVGVDIGCGVLTVKIKDRDIDFQKLDDVIRAQVPNGQNVHEDKFINDEVFEFVEGFRAKNVLSYERVQTGMGTLGGGNHFIEVSVDDEGYHYLTIHTGSRYLGHRIATHYQRKAVANMKKLDVASVIAQLKAEGRESEISSAIKNLKANQPVINKELAHLEGQDFEDYINDMKLTQDYALINRETIFEIINEEMGWSVIDMFDTIHNYIDTTRMILRKGAVSSQKGEKLIIPLNMKEGSIIAVGKGNEDWNFSAPHGAGRVFSRRQAKKQLSMDEFKETMKDVWTTSVSEETLDEAPKAYKDINSILDNIHDTVDIVKIIKPVYNFKSSD